MNVITKIGLKGVGPFLKPAVFSIPAGISYLYGKNLLAGGNANASGKSTFASSIAEIFYDEPIVGTRQDKSKTGSRFIEFKRGKKRVRVAAAKNKLSLVVDGEDKSGRTNANTKEVIHKVWPLTYTDFTTYVYLDSVVPHPLARGTTAERKAFFNTFFGLDRLDAQKKVIQAELLKLRKSKAAYTELKASYTELAKGMLAADELARLEVQYKKTKSRVVDLQEAAEKYQEQSRLAEFSKLAAPYLEKLKVDPKEIPRELKQARNLIAQAEEYEEQVQEYRAYLKALDKFKQASADLDMNIPIEELKKQAREYSRIQQLIEDAEDPPKKVPKPIQPDGDFKKLIALQSQLEHALDHASKFAKGKCPTCGQEVEAEKPELLKANLKKVEAQLEEWEDFESAQRKYARYKELLKDWEKEQEEVEAAKRKLKSAKTASELYEKRVKLIKPEKVVKPQAVEGLEKAKADLKVLEFLAPHVELIEMLAKADLSKKVEFNPKELNKAQDSLGEIRTKLEVHKSVAKRAVEVRKRLRELKAEVENEEALKLLLEGYSDKAVKKMVIEAISNHLMTTINQYSQLVFSGYKFEFVWGPQVQLLVHRPKLGTTDVRKLSGAESKLFTIILVLALMKFVPRRKRLNLLIMDEPTASFSQETVSLFHKILPQLNQVIPSILVITPKASERYAGANEFTVVRDAQGSYIKKGHPSEV